MPYLATVTSAGVGRAGQIGLRLPPFPPLPPLPPLPRLPPLPPRPPPRYLATSPDKNLHRSPLAALAMFALLPGCVAMSQYEKLEKENHHLHERVDRMEGKIEAQVAELKDLIKDLKPLIDKKVLEVDVVDGRVTIGLQSDVLFASGSASLSPDGAEAVRTLTKALSRRATDHDFQVEGHTDNEAIHTAEFPDNWYLGAARGITVVEAMIVAGFPAEHVSAASFADTHPVEPNSSASGRAANRRIDVVVLPDVTDLPGYKKLMDEGHGKTRRKAH